MARLLILAALLLPDVTPRSSTFDPRRLVEERSFAVPESWLMGAGGRFIVTETEAGELGLIDAATGRNLGPIGDASAAGRHDWNWGQSDRVIATTSNDGTVRAFDATTRKEIASLRPHAGMT
jgi:hypothetical protein